MGKLSVSWANRWTFIPCRRAISPSGAVLRITMRVPRTEPCGTPNTTGRSADILPFIWIRSLRFAKYDSNHARHVAVISNRSLRQVNMIVWSIVSNAADRSSSTSMATHCVLSAVLSLCCGLDDKQIAFDHISRCLANVYRNEQQRPALQFWSQNTVLAMDDSSWRRLHQALFLQQWSYENLFNGERETPVANDTFTISAMTGAGLDKLAFSRWVWIGPNLHDLQADMLTSLVISLVVVGMNDDRYEEIPQGSSGRIDTQLSMLSRSRLTISTYLWNRFLIHISMDQGVSRQCSLSFCVIQKFHCPEKGFCVASLVHNSFDIELGLSSIKHILDNISWFMKISRSTINLGNLHRRSILRLSFRAGRMSSLNQGAAGRIVSHLVFNSTRFSTRSQRTSL